ncbi:hypothetical protein EBR16_08925, partial [bacterium]|nr:hypothetical protein [bacterium]
MDRRAFVRHSALASLGAAFLAGCSAGAGGGAGAPATPANPVTPPPAPTGRTVLGIDAFAAQGFASLKGLRCGLVTHRAGRDGAGQRTVDVLARA